MKALPAKIEIDPLSSSDEEDLESDCSTDKLHRPDLFTTVPFSKSISVNDVSSKICDNII